jgi:hypothetical protein
VGGGRPCSPARPSIEIHGLLAQDTLYQIELDLCSRGWSNKGNLTRRIEDAIEPTDKGHHNSGFGSSTENHESASNQYSEDTADCSLPTTNFNLNLSLHTRRGAIDCREYWAELAFEQNRGSAAALHVASAQLTGVMQPAHAFSDLHP